MIPGRPPDVSFPALKHGTTSWPASQRARHKALPEGELPSQRSCYEALSDHLLSMPMNQFLFVCAKKRQLKDQSMFSLSISY